MSYIIIKQQLLTILNISRATSSCSSENELINPLPSALRNSCKVTIKTCKSVYNMTLIITIIKWHRREVIK